MKRLAIVVSLLVLLGAILLLARRPDQPPPAAPVVVLPLPYKIPPQKVSLFDRWAPRQPSWNWLWRLKDTVAGRPKVCDFGATVVDFGGAAESFLADHPLPAPAATCTNGTRIWLLSEQEVSALGRALRQKPGPEVLCIPRITTADGMQASLFTGGTFPIAGTVTPVGLTIDFLPHARPEGMDVTTIVSYSEVITNQTSNSTGSPTVGTLAVQDHFEVASRLQIPKGSGAFLLAAAPTAPNQKRIGVLLSVSTSKPK